MKKTKLEGLVRGYSE